MTIRRLQPAPRDWVRALPGHVGRWIERVTRFMLVTGRVDVTLDPASVPASTTSEQAFTVTGAQAGDAVIVTKPTHTAGIGIVGARVSDTDEVSITFINPTGSGVNPPSEEYRIWLLRWRTED